MNPIRLLNLGLLPPWQTQAVYHLLAERMTVDKPDTIIICRPDAPHLCLGYHQVFESVFDKSECERRGLPVFRRRLGGGATYLDQHQIFYQCIFHHSRMPAILNDIYALALAAPVNTLKRIGLSAELCATNEIEVDGKRVAGTGGGRIDEACVVVGNLLFDFDFEAMTAVWRTPSSSFRLLAEQALRERITTLNRLEVRITMEQVTELLIEDFSSVFKRPLQSDRLTEEEMAAASELAQELTSAEFLGLHQERLDQDKMRTLKISARAFIHSSETRVAGYEVRGSFWVSHDVIRRAKLESEPVHEWRDAEAALQGIPFRDWQEQIHVQ
jgi:lipoate-protein ligase A